MICTYGTQPTQAVEFWLLELEAFNFFFLIDQHLHHYKWSPQLLHVNDGIQWGEGAQTGLGIVSTPLATITQGLDILSTFLSLELLLISHLTLNCQSTQDCREMDPSY